MVKNNEDKKKKVDLVFFHRSLSNYAGENYSNSTHLSQMEAVVHHDVFDSRDVITSKRSSNSFAEDF